MLPSPANHLPGGKWIHSRLPGSLLEELEDDAVRGVCGVVTEPEGGDGGVGWRGGGIKDLK